MCVIVKTLNLENLTIHGEASDLIKCFKARIEGTEGIPSDEQCLIFEGNKVDDERSLIDYHIESGSTLNLLLRLKAGAQIFVKFEGCSWFYTSNCW